MAGDVSGTVSGETFGFIDGTSKMAEAIRRVDWRSTVFGPVASWPQSLQSALSICIGSSFPIAIYWGPQLALLYNDDWSPILGSKHPNALGRPAAQVWPEIWDTIGPLFERVVTTGQATRSKDQLLAMHRHGFTEECYFDYTFSPIRAEGGKVEGIFNAVVETTFRVIGERRTALLRDLGERVASASQTEEVWTHAMEVLRHDPYDVPFAGLYMSQDSGDALACVASVGPPELLVDLGLQADVNAQERPALVTQLSQRLGRPVHAGPWPESIGQAMLIPVPELNPDHPDGVLVVGLSPRLSPDSEYQVFLERIALAISTATVRARTVEKERVRAEELAKLDRAKTAFFSNVSHEFRTPLTLMLGPLADALAEPTLPASLRDSLGMVQRNAGRLSKLVNSLLEFSRIEAGRHQATYRPIDLCRLTQELASAFESAMSRAGLAFNVVLGTPHLVAYVDRGMWERVVLNLLSNALKFTLHGHIELRVRQDGDAAVLELEDSGVGVPEAEIPRLFERFHRVEGSEGRTHEGSGIGLALVQELVHLHGGMVSARSVLGSGTTFIVRLPLGKAHLPAERVVEQEDPRADSTQHEAYVQEALRWLPDADDDPQQLADAKEPHLPALVGQYKSTRGARVIVADDNADMRGYLHRLLSPYYAVELVANGEEALQAIRRARPDLVLSDVMMPVLDGFGLLAALRRDESLRTLPLILVSARAGEEARVEGLDAGADDYLIKPFAARELVARVGAAIELDKSRRLGEEQLRLGLASAQMFTWDLDIATSALSMSKNAGELLRRVPRTLEESFAIVDAQDAGRHRALMEDTIARGTPLRDEIRVTGPDGSPRWLEVRGQLVQGHGGRPASLAGVCFDITERKEVEQALQLADRRKDEFLAMLAHELRNPLAPIRSASELLLRLGHTDDRTRMAVGIVNRQVLQLTRLVDDLLDVSRITRGRIELDRDVLDLASVVPPALETVDGLMAERKHRVTVVPSLEPLPVFGDSARLQQCVVNLLTNAAKYTDTGGQLEVQTRRDGDVAVLTVTDNGVGIAPDLLPAVFDLFVQSERTLDRSLGGLGIGLSVVKGLVELHGGQVVARSNGLGKGATFEVRLPLTLSQARRAEEEPGAGLGRKVLVVDDNRDAADSLALMLSFDDHDVRTVFGAEDALSTAADWQPDIVLLDIGLPQMDGYEVARRLRLSPATARCRLVALTGYGQPEDRRKAIEAGFDDHLVKPASAQDLIRVLEPPASQTPM